MEMSSPKPRAIRRSERLTERGAGDYPRLYLQEETVGHVQALLKAALQDPSVSSSAQ